MEMLTILIGTIIMTCICLTCVFLGYKAGKDFKIITLHRNESVSIDSIEDIGVEEEATVPDFDYRL